MSTLREDCDRIVKESIEHVLPGEAVRRALDNFTYPAGRLYLVAIGKAAYKMAESAYDALKVKPDGGVVITKYGHAEGTIPGIEVCEAGHPVLDENTFEATAKALKLTENLSADDTVIFLVSGGGSALFEQSKVSLAEMQDITGQLLKCGADITEINTIRKRLSSVKGGKFAKHVAPAHVFSIILSDVLGDNPSSIASGPAWPDSSSETAARDIAEKYALKLSKEAEELLSSPMVKELDNVDMLITGSVRELCKAAGESAEKLGYKAEIVTDMLDIEASEAGHNAAEYAKKAVAEGKHNVAYIWGGETVVHIHGTGLGGRNQELALTAAKEIDGMEGVAVFSVGSDGTDGPTDAAGGYADGKTAEFIRGAGRDISDFLDNNDSYYGLRLAKGLLITGPTGTNVNDVTVLLVK